MWNLVAIAAERYLAVCRPFKHCEFTRDKIVQIWVSFYIMTVILNFSTAFEVGPSGFLWVRFRGGSRIPRRKGRQPARRGRQPMILPKISKKLHEIEKILGRRGERALDPPLRLTLSLTLLWVYSH